MCVAAVKAVSQLTRSPVLDQLIGMHRAVLQWPRCTPVHGLPQHHGQCCRLSQPDTTADYQLIGERMARLHWAALQHCTAPTIIMPGAPIISVDNYTWIIIIVIRNIQISHVVQKVRSPIYHTPLTVGDHIIMSCPTPLTM